MAVKVEVAPGQWETPTVTAIDDFDDIRINTFDTFERLGGSRDYGHCSRV